MSIHLCVLASGSGGNSSVVRTDGGVMLIDAGIGPRVTARRLSGTGVSLADIRAICLTHLDRDHFSPAWLITIRRLGIRLFCHHRVQGQLSELIESLGASIEVETFDGKPFSPTNDTTWTAVSCAHDEEGSHGFVVAASGCRLGYATDLGHVPPALIDRFCGVDLLAIESNYDAEMQLASGRPWFLKRRIMGGKGHLSNDQALLAVRAILDRCRELPRHIVLLHRSRECNCPKLLRELFERDRRIAPRLTLSEQFTRTEWLSAAPRELFVGEQIPLFAGT